MNHFFTFENNDELVFETPTPPKVERAVRMCGQGITLRKLSPDETMYDPIGRYFESTVVLPNLKANALKELTGFHVAEVTTEKFGGSIGYQMSNDGGTTWYTFDMGSWTPAVGPLATVFVTREDVEKFIGLLPLLPLKQVRLRAKLTPSADGKKRPLLAVMIIDTEYDFDFQEDLLRSLKHHLEALVRVRVKWVEAVTAGTSVTVDSGLVVTSATVFNLTTDPGRLTNLFSSIGIDSKTVSFAPAQTGKIEVNYAGAPKVFIAAEENFQLGSIPAVLINVPSIVWRKDLDTMIKEYDVNRQTFVARHRHKRGLFDANITLSCQAQLRHMATALADAVEKALQPNRSILSEALGELYAVLGVGPKTQADQIVRSLFSENLPVVLAGKAWLRPEYEEVPVSKKVITNIRPADDDQIGGSAGSGFTETFEQGS